MDGRAESSRSGARSVSPSSVDDRNHYRRSISPDARMRRRDSRSRSSTIHHSRSRSRSVSSDASMSPRFASPRSRSHTRVSPSASPHQGPDRTFQSQSAEKTALRIDPLTHNVRESHLRHIFGWYGRVLRVHLTPGVKEQRSAWAYVIMSSVGEAAKAALYMSGGQIDGASLIVTTCEVPKDLPAERTAVRRGDGYSHRDRGVDYKRWPGRAERRDRDRTGGYDHVEERGVHPDRQRMIGGGTNRYAPGRTNRNSSGDAYTRPMRRWGQPDSNRGRDRSLSPQAPPPHRRSSGAMRASPSY